MRQSAEFSSNKPRLCGKQLSCLIKGFSLLLCIVPAILLLATNNLEGKVTNHKGNTRTRTEIETLIKNVGRTTPDWWDSVQLNYPETLELTWPLKPEGPWNNRKNVGQYIWDIINPNPGRWQEGIKLVHHILILNKNAPAKRNRTMDALGRMYHDLPEDWARAAFWWRKSTEMGGRSNILGLAHCYWKLGNKDMAVEILSKIRQDYTRYGGVIKLWADMGEFDTALKLAKTKARNGMPDSAYMAAGDACRLAGRYKQALDYYQKVLAAPIRERRKEDIKRNKNRARANIRAIKLFDALDLTNIPDGTYSSNSIAYAGQLHIEVTVKGGRIELVRVTEHKERQFYSALTDTPKQIIEKQGVKGVDAVTGATMTSEAIINATAQALASGMK